MVCATLYEIITLGILEIMWAKLLMSSETLNVTIGGRPAWLSEKHSNAKETLSTTRSG